MAQRTDAEEHAVSRGSRGVVGSIVEVVVLVGIAFVLALLIQQFVVKPFAIQQVSMLPTLEEGDRLLVNRFEYRFTDPKRGDIVVLETPAAGEQDLVKRIVAVGGDTVAVVDGRLLVNGEVQEEPYLNEPLMDRDLEETPVPEGTVYVMGDNRNQSGDSRAFGPVPEEDLLGEGFLVYWPLTRLKWL